MFAWCGPPGVPRHAPEADALLDAIFEHPDDDTPRLVFADWLQEHDQEAYAQFIRLQCAVAREKLWSDEANRLWEELGRVWTRLDEEWWPATRDDWSFLGGANLDAVHFERGMLRGTCALTSDQRVQFGNSCWPWLPFPEMTLRSDPEDEEVEAPDFPRLSRIRYLRVKGWHRAFRCWPFVSSPQLSNLEVLDFSGRSISNTLAEQMLAPNRFLRLREVRLAVYDEDLERTEEFEIVDDQRSPSAQYLRELRRRFEARFEKVVWRTDS